MGADSSFAPRPRAHRRQADSDRAAVSEPITRALSAFRAVLPSAARCRLCHRGAFDRPFCEGKRQANGRGQCAIGCLTRRLGSGDSASAVSQVLADVDARHDKGRRGRDCVRRLVGVGQGNDSDQVCGSPSHVFLLRCWRWRASGVRVEFNGIRFRMRTSPHRGFRSATFIGCVLWCS